MMNNCRTAQFACLARAAAVVAFALVVPSVHAQTSTVSAGSHPYAAVANTATNMIYVVNGGGSSVTVIDGSTNTVKATVPVGMQPGPIAVNPATNMIYAWSQSRRR